MKNEVVKRKFKVGLSYGLESKICIYPYKVLAREDDMIYLSDYSGAKIKRVIYNKNGIEYIFVDRKSGSRLWASDTYSVDDGMNYNQTNFGCGDTWYD